MWGIIGGTNGQARLIRGLAMGKTPSPPPLELCQPLDFVDSRIVLAPNSEALIEKELCDLIVSLEADSSGYEKEIACILAGKASKDLIRKVEKSLGSEKKRSVATLSSPSTNNYTSSSKLYP
jgi:hypothetical protein